MFVLRQLEALQELGVELSVLRVVPIAPPFTEQWQIYRSIPEHYRQDGVTVLSVRAWTPPRMLGLPLVRRQVLGRLQARIAAFSPHIVHAHCLLPPGLLAVGCGRPVVLTAHGSDAYVEPWLRRDLHAAARQAVLSASRVVAVSRFVKGFVQRLGRDDASVIYNGADETIFAPADRRRARESLGIAPSRRVIAFAGNLKRSKGIFDLVDAIARLSKRPLLVFAGTGPDERALRSKLAAARVEHRLMGALAQADLANVYGAADIVTLPSHGEGLPAVVCEAMLSGRAVVATAVGGIPEVIGDGDTGLLVPPSNPDLLAQAIDQLLASAERLTALERNARAFAATHLTWRVNARRYAEVYRAAVEAPVNSSGQSAASLFESKTDSNPNTISVRLTAS